MNKKSYLLPHSYQIMGWWLMLASLACLLCYVVIESAGHNHNRMVGTAVGSVATCLPFLSLILLCISKEKEEDEYIQSLRAKSLFIVVVYAFIVNMIAISLSRYIMLHCSMDTYASLNRIIYYCTNIPLMTVLYIAIFKGSLLINKFKIRNDR